jgi:hypothetical protein
LRGLASALALAIAASSCGYRVAGKADVLPDEIQTIAIPPVENASTEYKIEQALRSALVHEFNTRTRYRITSDPDGADAMLTAVVLVFNDFPVNFDPATDRASTVQTETQLHVALWDRKKGGLIYENPHLVVKEMYEVSIDPAAYFEERQVAILRASRAAAREVVSGILSGF